jgi:4-hydroxybenzoate polyprenyltransferase
MLLKRLFLFAVPALALLFSGVSMRLDQISLIELVLIIWATISGILIVYRYNDFACGFSSSWKPVIAFFSDWSNTLLVAQFFLIGIPLSWFYLNEFQFVVLALAGILGIAYAVKFQWGDLSWFPKRKFPIKNILIGCVWAALFIVGYGQIPHSSMWGIYGFIAVQVFIGSIVRDVPDAEVDLTRNSSSLPIMIGANKTVLLLHVFNWAALCFAFLDLDWLFPIFFPTVLWRSLILFLIQRYPNNAIFTQWANLYTCLIIFATMLFFG